MSNAKAPAAAGGAMPARIRLPSDQMFDEFHSLLADDAEGFVIKHNKKDVKVWVKLAESTGINVLKVKATSNLSPEVIYDMLHDGEYRETWDDFMVDHKDLCRISETSDIGYYAMKWPVPLSNRDLVNQRFWRRTEDIFTIINNSVTHKECPPRAKFVRAVSVLTGFSMHRTPTGSIFYYVTQTDPKGQLPKFIVNAVTTSAGPKMTVKLFKAAAAYPAWKAKHQPDYRPWDNIAQSRVPVLSEKDFDQIQLDLEDSLKQMAEAAAQGATDDTTSTCTESSLLTDKDDADNADAGEGTEANGAAAAATADI